MLITSIHVVLLVSIVQPRGLTTFFDHPCCPSVGTEDTFGKAADCIISAVHNLFLCYIINAVVRMLCISSMLVEVDVLLFGVKRILFVNL